jgi:galactoside O-acetyltransferase
LSGIATPLVDSEFKGNVEYGTVIIGRHSIIGSGSVVLPNVNINDGATVGALSLVNKDLEEWGLYAGIPAKKIKSRAKEKILDLEKDFVKKLND